MNLLSLYFAYICRKLKKPNPIKFNKKPPLLDLKNEVGYFNSHQDNWENHQLRRVRKKFNIKGFCCVCMAETLFMVNYSLSEKVNGKIIPGWRESLHCMRCGLSNRARATFHVFYQFVKPSKNTSIYITEAITPLYRYLSKGFNIVGSEYLGNSIKFGHSNDCGIRNETLTSLTFPNQSFDVILSLDVFEHIFDIKSALKECHRVLKSQGKLIFTVPFFLDNQKNTCRAILKEDGKIQHILPPEYHGNPLDKSKGSLAYYNFGWELLELLKNAGFSETKIYFYWSDKYGYLGRNQLILIAFK